MTQKILLIDDEESIRFAFGNLLLDEGYEVSTAADYETACRLLEKRTPDLVITDILLGRSSGIDVLQEIKRKGFQCPVIMITGQPNVDTSAKALRLGAFDYLSKPIQTEKLLHVCKQALERKQLMEKKNQLEADNAHVRQNMELIFQNLKDGILMVDQSLRIIEANDSVKNICGICIENGQDIQLDISSSKCSGACLSAVQKAIENRQTVEIQNVECRHSLRRGQVVQIACIPLKNDQEHLPRVLLVIKDNTKLITLEKRLHDQHRFHRVIGKSPRMRRLYELLESLKDVDSSVLITGETGTGKELVAAALHFSSPRKEMPFIKVNCSALAEGLLESELFGHVKGAFTGAYDHKVGRFESANHGTLFLDEIGDISPLIQIKLLRALQEKEIERVGSSETIKVDVRVITATNVDLEANVRRGLFRQDLYYRIKVVNLSVPPLRDRREDLPLLTEHFIQIFNKRFQKNVGGVSHKVADAFMRYPWPGNVRELEHAIEHGFVLCPHDTLMLEHLPAEFKSHSSSRSPAVDGKEVPTKEAISNALLKSGGNKAKAARILGISRRTIYRKMAKYKIASP